MRRMIASSLAALLAAGLGGAASAEEPFDLQALVAAAEAEPPLQVYSSTGKIVEQAEAFARKYGVEATGTKAVFSETSLPPKAAEAIGKEAHVRVVAGDDALYGDSLGPPGSDGDTYLKMLRHNTKVIVDNLR